jgi:hypothetical protein
VTDEDRIAEMFGAPRDREAIAKVERVIEGPGQGPGATLQFDPDDELAKVSPAAAMTRELMASGEDPIEFLHRRGIPYNTESHDDDPNMAEILRMSPEELAQLEPKPVDPDFPDRPNHPHFWALSEAVKSNDGYIDSGKTIRDVFDLAQMDADSVIYMANQRGARLIGALGTPANKTDAVANMASGWVDGFLAGLKVGDGRSTPLPGEIVLDEFTDTQHRGNKL